MDLDASRDGLPGKPILSLFLCSSLFHLWPELTGPATPKPAGRRVTRLERGALSGFPSQLDARVLAGQAGDERDDLHALALVV